MVVWGLVALKVFWFSLFFPKQGCLDGRIAGSAGLQYVLYCTVLYCVVPQSRACRLWIILHTATLAFSHLSAHPPIYLVGYGISHMMNMY